MGDVLLLAAVAAVFVLGYWIARKLDRGMEATRPGPADRLAAGDRLRIGFSDPLAAGGLTDVLEGYSRSHPEISLRLLGGTEAELLKALDTDRLDVVFLSGDVANPARMRYDGRQIRLTRTPVRTRCAGLPVEPVSGGAVCQRVLWAARRQAAPVRSFLDVLETEAETLE